MLVLVAGACAILASIALAFLVRMRSDAEESIEQLRDTQARLMLVAACDYVCEAGRLGYDAGPTPPSGAHVEAWGWIDARDGRIGPRGPDEDRDVFWSTTPVEDSDDDRIADRPAWPAIGGVVRAPMYAQRRPPFAISPEIAPNAIRADDTAAADYGLPLLRNPDPVPATGDRAAWLAGDPTPRAETVGLAWFRCYRDGPATFVVTCGAGASEGFRDWRECHALGRGADFADDPAQFAAAVADEARLWYRIEWSGAAKDASYHDVQNEYPFFGLNDHYAMWPNNSSDSHQCQSHTRGFVGTIRWVQRLRAAPAKW